MSQPFWLNNPAVLVQHPNLIPTESMSYDEKLNATSRLIIITAIFWAFLNNDVNLILLGFILLLFLVVLYFLHSSRAEGFRGSDAKDDTKVVEQTHNGNKTEHSLDEVLSAEFYPTTKSNPLGNMLLTDIMDDPEKKAAKPAFNPAVTDDINKRIKQQTQRLNPTIDNAQKQLYGDLWENDVFSRQFARTFYSMPNTRVTNDQGAYAKYLYGDMYSAKQSGIEGAIMRVKDNLRYIIV